MTMEVTEIDIKEIVRAIKEGSAKGITDFLNDETNYDDFLCAFEEAVEAVTEKILMQRMDYYSTQESKRHRERSRQ